MPEPSSKKRQPAKRASGKRPPAEPAGTPAKESFPIVGIGASAGGLEAFRQLLQNLPADTGAAFVLVQHLDPKHESILPALLARSTAMPVGEVRDGVKIEPDHAYVIPSSMDLAITDGHLKLLPRAVAPERHMPIDLFFRTLAEVRAGRAIGVVLSGTASDGTLGLMAIKAAGGMCLAQDPQSAAFDGMPRNAIASGCVDAVLPPDGLALEIAKLTSSSYLREPGDSSAPEVLLEAERVALDRLFTLLKKATGKDLAGYKKPTLLRRIRRRMALRQIEELADYAKHLESHPSEVQDLYQDLLINVTSFFRDPQAFAALCQDVIPRLLQNRSADDPVRVWVPGCSTGEEVYSLAICLLESLDAVAAGPSIQIFGTDIRDSAVEKARAGYYLENITAEVSPGRLARFFAKVDGHFQVSKAVRDLCVFACHDLIRDPPFSHLDLISCRNVLIYLEPGVQRRVMANFHYALNRQGFLVLGSSETAGSSSDLFLPIDREYRVFTPLETVAHTIPGPGAGTYPGGAAFGTRAGAVSRDSGDRGEVQREADRILLNRYGPPGVLVDDNLEILQFRGDTHPYVEHPPGSANLSLPGMIQKGLLAGLRETIQEARATRAPVGRQGLTFRHGKRFRSVDLEVVPVQGRSSGQLCFLVLFAETQEDRVQPAAAQPLSPNASPPRQEKDRQIAQLERELATTQQYLQAVIEDQSAANEELQAANEEILSSNEELQSLNEELETAKEELQSSNEELNTLNDELRNRNLELGLLGDDLVNLLAGLHIPVVLLSPDLRLRRFTPAAARLMNLLPSDVNRPLSDIRPNFDLPSLEVSILEAIETVTVIERQVQDRQGCWYSLRIRPYKTRDNRIDGAVMLLVDVDALKRAAVEVAEARDFADSIIETVREPLLVLAAELRVERANRTFYDTFRVGREETEGRFLHELGNGQWDVSELRGALRSILADDHEIQDFEVEHEFPQIGRRTMVLNARRVRREGQGAEKILVAIEDRTELKKVEEERALLFAREQHAARQAEAAGRLKDEFLATVSHELRGPLSAMSGWIHVLGTDRVDAATLARGLAAIERNVQAQARLVEDLLDAARITTGKLRLSPFIIDLLPVVEAAVETVRAAADAKGVVLDLAHDGGINAVLGDPDRLQQVAWNLLSNAVKFTPGEGRVEVWLGRQENFVQLRVRDTGQGISPEFLPHVFKRFRQEESSPARSQTGLGLGLSIVRNLTELHGGAVSVASPGEGQGATFTVSLPVPALLIAKPPDGQPARLETGDGRPLAGLRLLVVEDEPTGREMLVALLEQYGAEVVATASADEALTALERAVPDVLLSDIGMPGESGYDLLRRVRALPVDRGGRVPAIAFTAYSSSQDRLESLDAGFQAHLAKPTDPARLVAMITALAPRAG
ncbi:MAG: chemotaxis protein CheB [Thermoanaerobaculia bacterium]